MNDSENSSLWGAVISWVLFVGYLLWFWSDPKMNHLAHWIVFVILGLITLFLTGYCLVQRQYSRRMEIRHNNLSYPDNNQIRRYGIKN